jgi:hypothetical protein
MTERRWVLAALVIGLAACAVGCGDGGNGGGDGGGTDTGSDSDSDGDTDTGADSDSDSDSDTDADTDTDTDTDADTDTDTDSDTDADTDSDSDAGADAGTDAGADAANPDASTPDAVNIGINLLWIADWDSHHFYADLVKQARPWGGRWAPNTPLAAGGLDTDGWPTGECAIVLANAAGAAPGTYRLVYDGSAAPGNAWDSDFTFTPVSTVGDTHSYDVVVPEGFAWIVLTFSAGVRNVRMMRPGAAAGDLISPELLNAISPFSYLRVMHTYGPQAQGVMGNTDTEWETRGARPTDLSFQKNGACLEHLVALANRSHEDLWINVPYHASDDYIRAMAEAIRYGTDGQGNPCAPGNPNPVVNAPLDPALGVYVEFNNELWNTGLGYNGTLNHDDTVTEVGAGDPHLLGASSTGSGDWGQAWRRVGWFAVRTSQLFREVFGDSQMPYTGNARVRPILAGQLARYATMIEPVDYIETVWGTASAAPSTIAGIANPKQPFAYYVYALSGAPYFDMETSTDDGLTADQIYDSMRVVWDGVGGNHDGYNLKMAGEWLSGRAVEKGVAVVAYEGGQGLIPTGHSDAAKVELQDDPRMRAMTIEVLDHWMAQPAATGFTYFTIVANDMYGLGPTLYGDDLDTQKWQAVRAVIDAE